jgi:hypothetical protein
MGVEADFSELRAFITDLQGEIPRAVAVETVGIVQHGMLNIKSQMIAEMRASDSFKGVAPSISYETKIDQNGITGEAGPDKGRPGGPLANIAYFGSSRGGGTVTDPRGALEAEVPTVEKLIGEAVEKAFRA